MSIISNTLQIAEISFFVGTQGLGEVFRVCPKWHAFLLHRSLISMQMWRSVMAERDVNGNSGGSAEAEGLQGCQGCQAELEYCCLLF